MLKARWGTPDNDHNDGGDVSLEVPHRNESNMVSPHRRVNVRMRTFQAGKATIGHVALLALRTSRGKAEVFACKKRSRQKQMLAGTDAPSFMILFFLRVLKLTDP